MSVTATNRAETSAPDRGWRGIGYAVTFWVLAVVGAPIMTGAWLLLSLASLEEVTEQPKALSAGSTMAGTTIVMGVLPLVLAHIIGLAVLCTVGGVGSVNRRTGMLRGVVAVVVASLIGLGVVWMISGGELIYTFEYVP